MTKTESFARKKCANYNVGKCLGVMFSRINGQIKMKIDSEYAGKDCKVDYGNCSYFNQIVTRNANVN
tara:strand:- start:2088 stop:2288 length:201 start_codon:yes stop_codon:yes gene_type:complete